MSRRDQKLLKQSIPPSHRDEPTLSVDEARKKLGEHIEAVIYAHMRTDIMRGLDTIPEASARIGVSVEDFLRLYDSAIESNVRADARSTTPTTAEANLPDACPTCGARWSCAHDATNDSESLGEQLSRLDQMATDEGETWDLSENDKRALRAVLMSHDQQTTDLTALRSSHAAQRREDFEAGWANGYLRGQWERNSDDFVFEPPATAEASRRAYLTSESTGSHG